MVQVTQTEDEINIIIELNRLITRKPDIVLLPQYIKFNNPPIFFERHLTHEVDELSSFCRCYKNEARIVLIKKHKGIWPELFQKFSKEELMKKRLEISDMIIERNKERDQKAVERYEIKRRNEIEKEVKRENAIRERVKQFEQNACREALMIGGKETHVKPKTESRPATAVGRVTRAVTTVSSSPPPVVPPLCATLAAVRTVGKISVCFSNYTLPTPKRESQANVQFPFKIVDENEKDNIEDNGNEQE